MLPDRLEMCEAVQSVQFLRMGPERSLERGIPFITHLRKDKAIDMHHLADFLQGQYRQGQSARKVAFVKQQVCCSQQLEAVTPAKGQRRQQSIWE